jgi:hypothetical protein
MKFCLTLAGAHCFVERSFLTHWKRWCWYDGPDVCPEHEVAHWDQWMPLKLCCRASRSPRASDSRYVTGTSPRIEAFEDWKSVAWREMSTFEANGATECRGRPLIERRMGEWWYSTRNGKGLIKFGHRLNSRVEEEDWRKPAIAWDNRVCPNLWASWKLTRNWWGIVNERLWGDSFIKLNSCQSFLAVVKTVLILTELFTHSETRPTDFLFTSRLLTRSTDIPRLFYKLYNNEFFHFANIIRSRL